MPALMTSPTLPGGQQAQSALKPRTSAAAAYGPQMPAPTSGLAASKANPSFGGGYGGGFQGAQTSAPGGGYYTGPSGSNVVGNMTYDPATGMVGSAGIAMRPDVDLDQQRRDRDLADYEKSLAIQSRFGGPTVGGGGGGGTSGGGGGGGGGGEQPPAGLGKDEILDILKTLRGDTAPREATPTKPTRIEAPVPTASGAATSQGFARAKDASGRIANQALQALRSQMIERGIEGSGIEGSLAANVLGETARGVSEAKFNQERAAEDQAWEGKKLGYQGGISQNANEMGFDTNIFGTNVGQRRDDMGQSNMLGLAPTVLSLLRPRY